MLRILILVLVVAAGMTVFSLNSQADVYVGQKVAGSISADDVSHDGWDRLLQKYVNERGQVNYRSWHQNREDRQRLVEYLQELSTVDPQARTSQNGRLAFWINAYNAVTVHGILQEYPTSSIRNHTPRVAGYNIWHDLKLYVDRKAYSLDDIEHKILRRMQEPRIHFAIVCASVGCPRLRNEAYTAAKTEQQLEDNARDFFSQSRNFRYDQKFYLSEILKWFGKDFGRNQSEQLQKIARWLPSEESRRAAAAGQVGVAWLDYDWNLNEQR